MKRTKADFAREFALEAHAGQFRSGGSPYFEHPERVAKLVRRYKGDSHEIESLVAAAYCHDTLEDTDVTYYDLVNTFDYCVASLVMELTTNPEMKNGVGNKSKYLAYKLKHMTDWALVIKLCDRYDNLSDMRGCTPGWCAKYCNETIYILDYLEKERQLTPTQSAIIVDLREALLNKKSLYWRV